MKKTVALLLTLALMLLLVGCAPTLVGEEALIEKATEEFAALEMSTENVTFAGSYQLDGEAVLWFISGKQGGVPSYLVLECKTLGKGEYRVVKAQRTMRSGDRIAIFPWKGGYVFLVNDPNCALVQVTDGSGVHNYILDGVEYPYVFFNTLVPTEYRFADKDGNLLSK